MPRSKPRAAQTSAGQQQRLMEKVVSLSVEKKLSQREVAEKVKKTRGKVRTLLDAAARGRDPGVRCRPTLLTTKEEDELVAELKVASKTEVLNSRAILDRVRSFHL